jgi:hypothetical protein
MSTSVAGGAPPTGYAPPLSVNNFVSGPPARLAMQSSATAAVQSVQLAVATHLTADVHAGRHLIH